MNHIFAVNIGTDTPWGTADLATRFPTIGSLVTLLLKNSFTIAGLILLGLLILGGLMFIMGAGNNDPKQAGQGKKVLTDAIIGFAVVFLAYFIIQIVQVITGLNILNSTL